MKKLNFHEDLSTLHVNTMPNRAYYIPYSRKSDALNGNREASERFMSLNGEWAFVYGKSLNDLPDDFDAAVLTKETIRVPSVWQTEGYGRQQYTNLEYPIPFDPPYVPHENPFGLYRREFYYEAARNGRSFLVFEGVDSCFYLWVNDEFVGYSQVSHCMSEFDVSAFIKRNAVNTITVLVLKWCDGTYLEDQDKFRTSGIFRDVYLLDRSPSHIRNYEIKTRLVAGRGLNRRQGARVTIDVEITGTKTAEYTCFDEMGIEVAAGHFDKNRATFQINKVTTWNAEAPYLYTLLLRCGGEYICEKIGVREITVNDGVLLLNGRPITLNGVNRHEFDPKSGPTVTVEHMRRDLMMMKQFNINAVRTSHYPNAPEFLKLCDELGFYVVAEADLECHGVVAAAGRGIDVSDFNDIADAPEFGDAILDRVQRCVIRDINRPCVILWSMGNESGFGRNFERAIAWTRHYDRTRLIHYEGARLAKPGTDEKYLPDVESRMYAPVSEIEDYFESDEKPKKPFMLCEFSHAMGNGPGDLEAYYACMTRHPGHCGGFVWEWCDHAFDMGRCVNGRKRYLYGGDFGDLPNDGNFCVDGLVSPERKPHTGLYEYKNVIRPFRVMEKDLVKGEFEIWNMLDFTNLGEYITLTWTVRVTGGGEYTGELTREELDIEPHGKKAVRLRYPIELVHARKSAKPQNPEGAEQEPERASEYEDKYKREQFTVLFTARLRVYKPYADAGHLLGYTQLGRRKLIVQPEQTGILGVRTREVRGRIVIDGENFHYVFNRDKVLLTEMNYESIYLIERPIELNIWRAPTDNDREIAKRWRENGYDRAVVRGYETEVEEIEGECIIRTRFSIGAASRRNIVEGTMEQKIDTSGALSIHVVADCRPDAPPLPRFGIRLFVPRRVRDLEYFGYGPYESYVDKHRASIKGFYRSTVGEQYVDYIRPQEHGSHYNCDYLNMKGPNGGFVVTGEGFCFSVSHYTQEELAAKKHNFELEQHGGVIICIDAFQNGIGSNSCGPELWGRYTSPKHIDLNLTLHPYFGTFRLDEKVNEL